jgi:hypothetical protein
MYKASLYHLDSLIIFLIVIYFVFKNKRHKQARHGTVALSFGSGCHEKGWLKFVYRHNHHNGPKIPTPSRRIDGDCSVRTEQGKIVVMGVHCRVLVRTFPVSDPFPIPQTSSLRNRCKASSFLLFRYNPFSLPTVGFPVDPATLSPLKIKHHCPASCPAYILTSLWILCRYRPQYK